jgi:hypothetical protein
MIAWKKNPNKNLPERFRFEIFSKVLSDIFFDMSNNFDVFIERL